MAEYIDREKVLIEMECGIRAGNYEKGFENYQHVNCMDDCLDVVRYADTADVVEGKKIDKAIEKIKNYKHGNGNMFDEGLKKAVEIFRKELGE